VNNSQLGGLAREEESSVNFTALVVEDDTHQRELLANLLKDEGLEVIECTSAEAAELVVASTGSELKALVTDVFLSGEMSGVELAQYAKRKFPHINVVMVSGRSPPYIPQDASFLLKPYRAKELLKAVLL
jgi:DNA-binding NtrC family response regulator